MGSGTVNIELSLRNNGHIIYKPLDVIHGNVKLKVLKEIAVEKVIVTFTGTARSEVFVKKNQYNGQTTARRTELKREDHRLVYQEVTIFPPENIRNVSTGNKFTMTPGNYEHDFQFKIPLNNQCCNYEGGFTHESLMLPPSMDVDGAARVSYQVQVTVKRASWFKPNPRELKAPVITPFDPLDELLTYNKAISFKHDFVFDEKIHKRIALTEKPSGPASFEIPVKKTLGKQSSSFLKSVFGSEKQKPKYAQEFDVPFTFEVRKSGPFVTLGHGIPDLGLFISSQHGPERYKGIDNQSSGLGEFVLRSLDINLVCLMGLHAEGSSTSLSREYSLLSKPKTNAKLDLADLTISRTQQSAHQYELPVPYELYKDITIPISILPSSGTCNIKIGYKLAIRAVFTEELTSWSSKEANITQYVKVLPGIPSPQEYISMYGIPSDVAQQALGAYPAEAFNVVPQGYQKGEGAGVDEKAALQNHYNSVESNGGASASSQLPEYQNGSTGGSDQLPEYSRRE